MVILDDFKRVTKRQPCPVCGKPDWCLVSRDGGDQPVCAICQRVESPIRFREAGWLHRLRDSRSYGHDRPRRVVAIVARPRNDAIAEVVGRCQAAMSARAWQSITDELALDQDALRRLRVGVVWGPALREAGVQRAPYAWLFPMEDAGGEILGARLRLPNGQKLSLRDGHEGLFVPDRTRDPGERLFVAEGETDTAALLGLGFEAIGRPSCQGGVRLTIEIIQRLKPALVVVVADNDPAGLRGAARLAGALAIHHPAVRVIAPPAPFKDVREWKRAGAAPADIEAAIRLQASQPVSVSARRMGA